MTVQPYTVRVVLRTGEIRLTLAAQSPHEALRLARMRKQGALQVELVASERARVAA